MIVARGYFDSYVAPFEGAAGAGIDCSKDVGRTKQADLKESDINFIMKRYEKTGTLPDLISKNPVFGDFSAVPDYQTSLNIVRQAEIQFNALDAGLRNRFDNDPAKFLAFCSDSKNLEELGKLGLLNDAGKAKLAVKAKAERDAFEAAEIAAGRKVIPEPVKPA